MPHAIRKPRNTSTCGGLENEFSLCLKVDEPEKLIVDFLVQGHRPERELGDKEVKVIQVYDLQPGVQRLGAEINVTAQRK